MDLLTQDLSGWRMAGRGGFRWAADGILESHGGSGLLWYAAQAFDDCVIEVSWRLSALEDNSGVFLRIPPLSDDIGPAIERGYEIQIDDRGVDRPGGRMGSPLHLTGAVYRLAPARRLASRAVGSWNAFRITAQGATITVDLNGEEVSRLENGTRERSGHIALQCHHEGSRVQFRDLRLTPIATRGV
jgi:hypothetical protein